MHVINCRNVNDGLCLGLRHLFTNGIKEESRNGPVLVAPTPVTTVYQKPWERVLFSPMRDANPFFHLMEALWMLAGRNDIELPAYYAANMRSFSDDGRTMWGAYGYRWRKWFGYDQIGEIANELKRNPTSRRAVLAMWDGSATDHLNAPGHIVIGSDLHVGIAGGKDVPCNTHAYFSIRQGRLDMTVCCRSNDIWWGTYGANAVHFSILQEFMAGLIGVEIGCYRQISYNFHIYMNVVPPEKMLLVADDAMKHNWYDATNGMFEQETNPAHLIEFNPELWEQHHIQEFLDGGLCSNAFLRMVAWPMAQAYKERKDKMGTGRHFINQMRLCDWRTACLAWINRRELKKEQQQKNLENEGGLGVR